MNYRTASVATSAAREISSGMSQSGRMLAALLVMFAGSTMAQVARPDPSEQSSNQTQPEQSQPADLPMIPWAISADQADGAEQTAMTAEQIISILGQHPPLLTELKASLERMQGVDPGSLTDDEVYSHIRQDDSFRQQISEQLRSRGYHARADFAGQNDFHSQNDQSDQYPESSAESARDSDLDNRERGDLASGDIDRSRDRVSNSDRSPNSAQPYPLEPAPSKQTRRPVEPGTEEARAEPQLRHRRNPYGELPSLRDLYSQIPPPSEKLRRFGSDTFRLGTGNANELPLDLPVVGSRSGSTGTLTNRVSWRFRKLAR
jgi:hypothetical protein